MAGAGFKSFSTGEVLLAADVNTYLMQQTVMVFDDASARTTALGANVAEGMMSYLKDTNKTYRYDGSSWLDDAGTTSPLTTKGDLWTYSTTDARLAVGTDGYTLVADSAEATGLKWAAAASGGSLTLLATGTLSGSVVTINSISGDYTDLRLDLIDFYASSDFYAQLKLNNVSLEYDGENTYYQSGVAYTATCEISGQADGSDQANFTTVRIPLYSVAGIRKFIYSWFNVANATTAANGNIGGWKVGSKITNAVTRLDINPSAGTWSGGTYNLYGVK